MKEKVLVIGSNSFSGAHFVNECMINGHRTWGISRSQQPNAIFLPHKWGKEKFTIGQEDVGSFSFERMNINDETDRIIEFIESIKPEIIVNFSAQGMVAESWNRPNDWYTTNLMAQVELTTRLINKRYLKKYVQISTPEVYGSTGDEWKKENFAYNPSTPYAVSKAACDMHLRCLFKTYGFPVIFTRAANVYGPGQQLYRIIPKTIISALDGRKMTLHGGGVTKRSFVHIKDVVQATLRLGLNAESGSAWHISSNNDISIKELVIKIFEACDGDIQKCVEIGEERKSKDGRYRISSENLRKEFNWDDRITLDNGIKETISWVKENWDIMKKLNTNYMHQR